MDPFDKHTTEKQPGSKNPATVDRGLFLNSFEISSLEVIGHISVMIFLSVKKVSLPQRH